MSCDDCTAVRCEVADRGNSEGNILIIGEAPTFQDVRNGFVFVSDAAKIMDDEMGITGVDRGDVFYTNAIQCQIDKKKLGAKINSIMESCRPNLVSIIERVEPKIIMTMGEIAYRQVMGTKEQFKDIVGVIGKSPFGIPILPNHHPASLQYQANKKGEFRAIFKSLAEFQKNGYKSNKTQIQYKIVDSIRDLLDGGLTKDETGKYITALDTETQGLLWYRKNSPLISYSIAASETMGYQVFLQEECEAGEGDHDIIIYRGGTQKKPLKVKVGIKKDVLYDQKVAELDELLRREDIKKYFMTMQFEKHRFYNIGCRTINGTTFDVGLAAHVLNSEEYVNVNLNTLIKHFAPAIETHKGIVSKADKGDMLRMFREDRDNTVKYSSLDACATLIVGRNIRRELLKDQKSANYYVKFAHPIETEFLFEIERNGFRIDVETLPIVADEVIKAMALKEQEFYNIAPQAVKDNNPGDEFRLTRSAVMKEILYKWDETDIGFGLEPPKFTETGAPSVDKEALREIMEMKNLPKAVSKIIDLYNEWSTLHTIHTRYLNNIKEHVTGGKLYPSYSLTFTSSGRAGARNPSIMNFQ